MSREWPEGTVAMVTWNFDGEPRTEMRFRYNRKVVGHVWESADGTWIGDSTAKNVRPLVVIDAEDAERVERLIRLQDKHFDGYERPVVHADDRESMTAALREFADPKPRIEEPRAMWSVIEDASGDQWVRVLGPDFADGWVRAGDLPSNGKWTDFCDIDAVREIQVGVTE